MNTEFVVPITTSRAVFVYSCQVFLGGKTKRRPRPRPNLSQQEHRSWGDVTASGRWLGDATNGPTRISVLNGTTIYVSKTMGSMMSMRVGILEWYLDLRVPPLFRQHLSATGIRQSKEYARRQSYAVRKYISKPRKEKGGGGSSLHIEITHSGSRAQSSQDRYCASTLKSLNNEGSSNQTSTSLPSTVFLASVLRSSRDPCICRYREDSPSLKARLGSALGRSSFFDSYCRNGTE